MASFNKIVIVGYLGKDPEIRYLPDGTAVCSFSMATTERKKDKSGEYQDATIWFKINVWGKQAEAANQYLSKGRQAYIEGRLSQQEYTDRDGNRRTSLEVRATDVQFLGPRGDGDGGGSQSSYQQSPPAQRQSAPPSSDGGEGDENIPF
ncbi:MAG: single-stranded DNA-binding protein [Acidobacteria bacterium]|nr:single-stranded DNA-binding protein [Acidobacteriota bacterium]